jgi:hypothetical protein
MLKYLTGERNRLIWVVFHAILGTLSILTPWFLIGWFYLVLFTSASALLKRTEDHFFRVTSLMVYVVSFELLGRMSKAYPFIPWEMGKYLLFLLLMAGILMKYRRGTVGWILLVLLLPALLIDESGQVWFKNIIFNLLGPVNVALAIVYFKNQLLSAEELKSLLRLLALPAISVLAFVVIKTPNFENIEFELGANFNTTGGFGSNQVSTVLGLGAFLAYLFWRNKWRLSGYRWLDLGLLIFFTIRGLLTFSRGGMIGGAIGVLVLVFYQTVTSEFRWSPQKAVFNLIKAVPVLLIFFLVFVYANNISGGNLALRYKGDTPGTVAGYKEKTLNVFFSNRVNVFKDDLELWQRHPVLGVGVGASMYLRDDTRRVAPHIELSRLLSEHGLLGAFYFLILCGLGYKLLKKAHYTTSDAVLLAIFVLALFTTFHSAMRTYISPLLIGLSMLTVYELNEVEQP